MEELLWRGGNPQLRESRGVPQDVSMDWLKKAPNLRVSNLIDMVDIELHTPLAFLRAVREALRGYEDMSFTRFENADRQLGFEMQFGSFVAFSAAAERVEEAFWQDYQACAEKFRIVLVLDTVERLSPIGPTWLRETEFLQPNDLKIYTTYWLKQNLEKMKNTVLLLAGRPEEGMLSAYRVIEDRLPDFSLLDSVLDRCRGVGHTNTCGAGKSYIVVNHQGRLAQCQMLLDQLLPAAESEDWLEQIQHGPLQNIEIDQKSECSACLYRYRCTGGCPLESYRTYGRWDAKSPNCAIYQALLPEILRLEALRLYRQALLH